METRKKSPHQPAENREVGTPAWNSLMSSVSAPFSSGSRFVPLQLPSQGRGRNAVRWGGGSGSLKVSEGRRPTSPRGVYSQKAGTKERCTVSTTGGVDGSECWSSTGEGCILTEQLILQKDDGIGFLETLGATLSHFHLLPSSSTYLYPDEISCE